MDQEQATRNQLYWRRTRRLTGWLLCVWALVCFGITFFARELSAFRFFGWPFSFWAAAQGGVFVFIALIAAYARGMARIDRGLGGEVPAAREERR